MKLVIAAQPHKNRAPSIPVEHRQRAWDFPTPTTELQIYYQIINLNNYIKLVS